MGYQEVETRATNIQEEVNPTYSIISYPAASLPDAYKNLIFSNWLRTLRHGNEYFKLINQDDYYKNYWTFINLLMSRPTCAIKLAVLSDEPDVCLGWSLVERKESIVALHYVYVKKDCRSAGIGTSLIPDDINTITHITTSGASIWASKAISLPDPTSTKPLITFNPFV
jgi:hypothetical protein